MAERTTAFCLEKPSNWTFKAGQVLEMTLVDPPETDAEGNARAFSIASGPHEDTLLVAIYYVAGPPEMVQGLHAMINQAGVDDDDIRTEKCGGY